MEIGVIGCHVLHIEAAYVVEACVHQYHIGL